MRQAGDSLLSKVLAKLKGRDGGGPYILDKKGLLWHWPIISPPRVAVPRSIIPRMIALIHTTYTQPRRRADNG